MYKDPSLPPRPRVGRRAGISFHGDPQGVETYLVWIIHRSSALRASTNAYGAGILSDAGVLCEPISLGRASDASDSSDPSDKTAQSAALHPLRVPAP